MALQIETFGNAEILKGVFDAIVMCLNSETGTLYAPLIRIGMIFSILWAAIYSFWGDFVRVWGRAIIPFIVVPPMLFIPTSSVYIHDVVTNARYKVDNVPYGLAYLAHFISTMGYEVTKQVDRVFANVDDLKYHKSGFLMASNLIIQAKTFRITNEDVAENMRQFVCQCVTYEAMLGRKYTLEDLRHTSDIWGLVSTNPSPIRSFLWREPHKPGEAGNAPIIVSCKEGVARFNTLWGLELDRTKTVFGVKLFGASNPLTAKQEFLKYLPLSYGFLSGLSKSADDILKQQMMIHSVIDGVEQKSVALGNAPNFAARRAYLQQRSTYETLGAMASESLNTMKAVLEAIAYAAFIFLIPLAILPFGFRILLSWAQILLWLQMWAPLYAVLNYIMTTTAASKSSSLLSTSNPDGITIASSAGLMNLNADMSAMAGYLAMSIPFLAIALVKGVGSFVHMASHLGNVSQSAAGQAAGESVTGNYSFGNLSEGNQQIANTNMLNHSQAATYRANSFQSVDGRTDMTTMSDGSQIVNVGTSNLPVGVNIAQTKSTQESAMATKSYQKAVNLSESSAKNLSSSYRQMVDLSHALGRSESMGDSVSQGISGEQSKAIHKTAQLVEDFADQNGLTTQKSAELLAEASVGGGVIFKGSIGGKATMNATDQEFLQKAEKFSNDKNFQEAARESAQASKSLSHSVTDDNSRRLSEAVSGSYESGIQQRSDASKSYNESEAYNKQAMNTLANSSSINANYNQQFVDWLAEQPADHTTGHIGQRGAADIIGNNPQLAMGYVNKFMDEQGLAPNTPLGTSPGKLRSDYEGGTSQLKYVASAESINAVRDQAASVMPQQDVKKRRTALRSDVDGTLSNQSINIGDTASDINQKGEIIQTKVTSQQGRYVTRRLAEKGIGELRGMADDGDKLWKEYRQK